MGVILGAFLVAASVFAAGRQWRTGTWVEVSTRRKTIDFGPGASPFGNPNATPSMRAMADVRTFVIETDDLRLELEDVVPIGKRSVDVNVGTPVTFALEKNAAYITDTDGKEYKLRVVRKTAKTKS
jgi:hypothetical protein